MRSVELPAGKATIGDYRTCSHSQRFAADRGGLARRAYGEARQFGGAAEGGVRRHGFRSVRRSLMVIAALAMVVVTLARAPGGRHSA